MKAFIAALALAPLAAFGQSADLQRCRALVDKEARLACYDGLAGAIATTKPAPVEARPDSFGLDQPRKNEAEVVNSHIEGLFDGWGPKTVINLANGQAWRINDNSSATVYLTNPKVLIRRGVMGTYVMELEGTNSTAKLLRLR